MTTSGITTPKFLNTQTDFNLQSIYLKEIGFGVKNKLGSNFLVKFLPSWVSFGKVFWVPGKIGGYWLVCGKPEVTIFGIRLAS